MYVEGLGMKLLQEINEALRFAKRTYKNKPEEIVEIAIGFDDHCSTYDVPHSALTQLASLTDMQQIIDAIIDYEYVNNSCEGEIFLDATNPGLGEFKQQIADSIRP